MSKVPDDIEGLGKASLKLRQNPAFDVQGYQFTSESYFVWSRIDGYTSLRDVILMIGFPLDQTLAILRDLRTRGALLAPGEDPATVAARAAASRPTARPAERAAPAPAAQPASVQRPAPAAAPVAAPPRRAATEPPTAGGDSSPALDLLSEELGSLSAEEAAAMAAQVDIPEDARRRILAMRRRIASGRDYFAALGVPRDADKRQLKRVYFKLSKEFHPDRYFGKSTGPFGPWLASIFETLSTAFEVLSNDKSRERYLAALSGGSPRPTDAETPAEHARGLFERGCAAEVAGDLQGALKLFAAAIRVDAQPRYLSRAARCAISARALDTAEEYAGKAAELDPDNPSILRILADVYRSARKFAQAESVLVRALELKNENDVLAKELTQDLAEVRALLG